MNKKVKNVITKTAKVAGITCFALGGAALITSGAALKAMAEGTKYLKETIQKILSDVPEAEAAVVEAEKAEETPAATESVQEEAIIAEAEAQEA